MKLAKRLLLTGSVQSIFFKTFIKENAEINNIKGFIRSLEDGKVDIFLEGESADVSAMADICKKGPKYAQIRSVEEKEERLQDFKEFKILRF